MTFQVFVTCYRVGVGFSSEYVLENKTVHFML